MINIILYLLLFVFSIFLTYFVQQFTLKKAILDIPSERSLHSIPIPRGGGVTIVVSFLIGLLLMYYTGILHKNYVMPLLVGGFFVAAIGFIDDIFTLTAKYRFYVQMTFAIFAVVAIGGYSSIDLGAVKIHVGLLGSIFAVLLIIWLTNLYNFMDGSDGIAAIQTIFVSFTVALFLIMKQAHGFAFMQLLLGVSTLGFLVWNWPPAKIFLGDVGSGFLGYIFALSAIITAKLNIIPLFTWLILLGYFIFDATFTLVYRLIQRKKVYQAHREHLYQRLISNGYTHKQVLGVVCLVNLFVLLPSAYISVIYPKLSGLIWLLLTIIALISWSILVKGRYKMT
ncbi:MAG: glycosyltransferase family 4 protein [Gammaproteobacteria bacterium]